MISFDRSSQLDSVEVTIMIVTQQPYTLLPDLTCTRRLHLEFRLDQVKKMPFDENVNTNAPNNPGTRSEAALCEDCMLSIEPVERGPHAGPSVGGAHARDPVSVTGSAHARALRRRTLRAQSADRLPPAAASPLLPRRAKASCAHVLLAPVQVRRLAAPYPGGRVGGRCPLSFPLGPWGSTTCRPRGRRAG